MVSGAASSTCSQGTITSLAPWLCCRGVLWMRAHPCKPTQCCGESRVVIPQCSDPLVTVPTVPTIPTTQGRRRPRSSTQAHTATVNAGKVLGCRDEAVQAIEHVN